jgi:hypothetical protein
MSLSPIIGAASQVLSLLGNHSNAGTSTSTPASSIQDSNGNVDLSAAAQLFSKLQDLSQSNPSQFKQLTAQVSAQLQADAQQATGAASNFLSDLSAKFNTASQTGSTASLTPHGHHGHHHSSSQAAYDSTNQTSDAQATANTTVSSLLQQLQSL